MRGRWDLSSSWPSLYKKKRSAKVQKKLTDELEDARVGVEPSSSPAETKRGSKRQRKEGERQSLGQWVEC